MKKKQNRALFIAIAAAVVLCAAALIIVAFGQNTISKKIRSFIKYSIFHYDVRTAEETAGLSDIISETLYVNGEPASGNNTANNSDCLDRVYETAALTRLVAYHDGYQVDLPAGAVFDFSHAATKITARGNGFDVTLTKEHSPYIFITDEMTEGLKLYAPDFEYKDGIDQYIGYYQSRFLLNAVWQENNGVSVSPAEVIDANGHKGYIFHAVIDGVTTGNFDAYTYVFIKTDIRDFVRIVIKYHSGDTSLRDGIAGLFDNFRSFEPVGQGVSKTDYFPITDKNRSDETAALYEKISTSGDFLWGIYTDDVFNSGVGEKIPALEAALEYDFDIVLAYVHSSGEFPSEFMNDNYERGRIVELTYQLTVNNNSDIRGYSPLLDIYKSGDSEAVREFARAAKQFGHPFLFRLCNEMNTDWTNYSGMSNMADPDIFVTVWRTIYRIFEEEGVNNCIWIFNPHDRSYPPSRWNDAVNYYPGNEYVQMIGVTGYNNGTYYTKWGEEWREFDVIYDKIEAEYGETFGAFPWIITEFASSSYGGDKAAWIDNMFEHIGDFENIKAAVWFSSADYDTDGTAARPYWLDETDDTLAAFRKGLKKYSVK